MPIRNIICISVDGLRASALGAYGNTWHPTPALDALASQSRVIDWMFVDRPTLDGFFDAAWKADGESLIEQLRDAGFQCACTTDDAIVAERAEVAGFGEVRHLEFASRETAATVADTELAQLFAVAIDQLAAWGELASSAEDSPHRRLLWLHARGYRATWDAPMPFRESLLDEDDPPPPTFVAPPEQVLTHDHDELLLNRAAYAAQTMVLDRCIEALATALVDFGLDGDTLVLLAGARGFALGEHGTVGGAVSALYGELVHVPCLVRTPAAEWLGIRSDQLAAPADIAATIIQAASLSGDPSSQQEGASLLSPAPPSLARQFVIITGDQGEQAIRTAAWMLRSAAAGQDEQHVPGQAEAELYLKPDDRWEANEIASRAPEVASRLLAVLDRDIGSLEGAPGTLDQDLISHQF
jgi:arylsulfatase A-like enzyme